MAEFYTVVLKIHTTPPIIHWGEKKVQNLILGLYLLSFCRFDTGISKTIVVVIEGWGKGCENKQGIRFYDNKLLVALRTQLLTLFMLVEKGSSHAW